MEKIFLGLGGNIGKVSETFEEAITEIEKSIGRST